MGTRGKPLAKKRRKRESARPVDHAPAETWLALAARGNAGPACRAWEMEGGGMGEGGFFEF